MKKKLGFGFMRLPILDERDRSTVDIPETIRMTDRFMERGFFYFDTAHRYNDEASEPALKAALTTRYPREAYEFTDKLTMNYIKTEEDLMPFFQKQLDICGLTYFDNYLVHNMGEASYPAALRVKAFEFLRELKRQGLTKRIGMSFHGSPEMLEKILTEQPDLELIQLQINYLDWNDTAYRARESYEIARKHGKQIVVMEPVKGGTLVNLPEEAAAMLRQRDPEASLASWAIRFAASLPGVYMVLSGMSTMEQVEDNTGYMEQFLPLTDEEMTFLEEVAAEIRKGGAISCTNCRYCTTECPMQIPIPDYFALYNNKLRLKNTGYMQNQSVYYSNMIQGRGKAMDCVKCGLCERNCPQSLPVRDLLETVSATFDK